MKRRKISIFLIILTVISIFLEACQIDVPDKELPDQNSELSWKWIAKPEDYEDMFFADEDLIAVKNSNQKYGIINMQGEMEISFEYDNISRFHDGISAVDSNGKSFYIDKEGKTITDMVFQNTYAFQEEMGGVQNNNLWGYIDLHGNLSIEYQFEEIHLFQEGMAAVKHNGKWGFIDKNGNLTVENGFDEVRDFNEGMAAVKIGDKWGFVDSFGNAVVNCQYEKIHDFQEEYAAVMKDGKWGFIDKNGKVCIELQYDDVGNFSEGKAAVNIGKSEDGLGKWAYIDKKNQVVIDFYPYDAGSGCMVWVGEFQEGMAFVSKSIYCIIDEKGENVFLGDSKFFISAFSYDSEYDIIPGYIFEDEAMKIKKYGLMGLDGSQRLEPVFDSIEEINGRYVMIANMIDGEYKKGIIELIQEKTQ